MDRCVSVCVATTPFAVASAASAAFRHLRIEQVHSNGDGSVQYIPLHETIFSNCENQWTGQSITGSGPGPRVGSPRASNANLRSAGAKQPG